MINGSSAAGVASSLTISDGKLRIHDGDLSTTSGVSLGASGILEIDGGSLTNASNGSLPSSVAGVSGSQLIFNGVGGGTFDHLISGTGLSLLIQSGTTNLTAANTFTGPLTMTGGTLDIDEDHTFTDGTLTFGVLKGAGDLDFTGTVDFNQFSFDGPGTITLAGTSSINAASTYEWLTMNEATDVINSGTFNITNTGGSSNDVVLLIRGDASGDANFTNLAAGIINFHTGSSSNDQIHVDGSNLAYDHILNQGTVNVSSDGAGFTRFDNRVTFTNDGQVNVTGGTLFVEGGSDTASTGDFAVSSGATLNFDGNTSTFASGSTISGAGTTKFGSGTSTFQAGATLDTSHVTLDGGTLDLTDDHSLGSANLNTGRIRGSGNTTFSGAVDLNEIYFDGPGTVRFDGSTTLNASSTYEWIWLEETAHVQNAGTFNISNHGGSSNDVFLYIRGDSTSDANFTNLAGGVINFHTGTSSNDQIHVDGSSRSYDHFVNEGTLNVSSDGSGYTKFDNGVTFTNDGQVNVTGGTLFVEGGSDAAATGDFAVSAGATLTFDGNTSTFASGSTISGAGSTKIASGTSTFQAGATLGTSHLILGGGTLDLADDHSLGSANLNSGRLRGSGDTSFSGTVDINQIYFDGPGTVRFDGTTTLDATGTHEWLQIEESGHVQNSGTFNISNAGASSNDVFLYLRGDATGDADITNLSGGVINFHTGTSGADQIHVDGSSRTYDHFVNEGTINVSTDGSGSTEFDAGVSFTNNGQVNTNSGTLILAGGSDGAATGDFAVATGARLVFNGGTFTFASGSAITGTGTTKFGAGTSTFQTGATLGTPDLDLSGGTLELADDHTLGTATLSSGRLGGTGNTTFTGAVDITQIYFDGPGTVRFDGTTTLDATSTYEWLQIEESGHVKNSGIFNVSNAGASANDVFLYLRGDATGDADFTNLSGGVINFHTGTSGADQVRVDGSNRIYDHFVNEGTINVSTDGSGYTEFDTGVAFTNNGQVNVNSGTLYVKGGSDGAATGDFAVSTGATLNLASLNPVFGSGSEISGAGTLRMDGATATFNTGSSLSITNHTLNSGTLNGTADLTLSGTTDIGDIYFAGTGVKTLAGSTTLSRSGTQGTQYLHVSAGTEVLNSGTFTSANSGNYGYYNYVDLNGTAADHAVFRNTGTFTTSVDTNSNSRVIIDGVNSSYDFFLNEGTFNATGSGSGYTAIDAGTSFVNSGTVNVTGAALLIQGGDGTGTTGDFNISDGARLDLDSGNYTFKTGSTISGDGKFEISGASASFESGVLIDVGNVSLASGNLSGSGAVSISGNTDIHDFTMAGTGIKTLAGSTTLSRSSTEGTQYLRISAGAEVVNSGTFTSTNSGNYGYHNYVDLNGSAAGDAIFRNTGTFTTSVDTAANSRVYIDGVNSAYDFFLNEGTFNATGSGSGYTEADAGVSFVNSGTVNVTGATFTIKGGDDTGTTGDHGVSSGATLNYNAGNYTFKTGSTFSGAGTLKFSGATAEVESGVLIDIGNVNLSSGTLTGTAAATISGTTSVSDFTFAGTGIKTLSGSSTIQRSGTNSGKYLRLSPGAEVVNSGAFAASNAGTYGNYVYIDLNGSASGNTTFRNTGSFTTTVDDSTYSRVYIDGNNAAYDFFLNEGTFNATGSGSGYTEVDAGVSFVNSGTVNVTGATLYLKGGDDTGTTGNHNISSGATLDLRSGNYTFKTGSAFSGAGTLKFSGATAEVESGVLLDVDKVNLSSGTLTGSGPVTISGTTSVSDFTIAGTGIKTLSGSSTIQRSGTNPGKYLRLSPGAELVNSGTFTASNSGSYGNYVYIDLNGSASGNTIFRNTGTFTTVVDNSTYSRVYINGNNKAYDFFLNEGTFNATGSGAGYTEANSGVSFVNSGTVNVTGTTLHLKGGDGTGTTGDFNVSSGATLNLNAGNYTFKTGSSVSGTGTLKLSGGNAEIESGVLLDIGNVNLSSGNLSGSAPATISGNTSISNFTLAGTGIKTLSGNSTIQRSGTNSGKYLHLSAGTEVVNSGSFTASNSGTYGNYVYLDLNGSAAGNATFRNTGTFTTVVDDSTYSRVYIDGDNSAYDSFLNEGTFNATGSGSGYTTIDAGTSFVNSGSINVTGGSLTIDGPFTQTGGSFLLNGGSAAKNGTALNINGGIFGGTGTFTGNIDFNGGELSPGLSPGTLNINGDLVLYSGSLFTIEIGGLLSGTQYDQLNVTGNADLSGATIQLKFINGFAPSASDSFDLLNVSGSFAAAANVQVSGLQPGWSFSTNLNSGVFTLNSLTTGFAAVPEPSTWALMIIGGLFLLTRRRGRR